MTNVISRFLKGGGVDEPTEPVQVILEEYRSLIRIANVLSKHKIDSFTVETPLGDFHFRGNVESQ